MRKAAVGSDGCKVNSLAGFFSDIFPSCNFKTGFRIENDVEWDLGAGICIGLTFVRSFLRWEADMPGIYINLYREFFFKASLR